MDIRKQERIQEIYNRNRVCDAQMVFPARSKWCSRRDKDGDSDEAYEKK